MLCSQTKVLIYVSQVMENASANNEQEVDTAIIDNDTPDVSETAKQINALPRVDLEVASLNENASGNSGSNSYYLNNTESKCGIYPDLSALTGEHVNPCGLEQSESNVDTVEGVTVNMGCVSSKESASESVTESRQNDSVYFRDGSKNEGEDIQVEDTDNDEKGKLFVNPADVCRPKMNMGSPIVSSFSAGNQRESEISTAIHERTGDADHITGLGDKNPQVSIPGRAVRLENQNDVESHEDDSNEVAALAEDTNSRRIGRGRGLGTKDHHEHNREKYNRGDRKKDHKFKGIDQNWKTNYDDAYEEAHEKYEYFWRKHTIYSQWHYSVFFDETVKFTCAEQFMMYQKASKH